MRAGVGAAILWFSWPMNNCAYSTHTAARGPYAGTHSTGHGRTLFDAQRSDDGAAYHRTCSTCCLASLYVTRRTPSSPACVYGADQSPSLRNAPAKPAVVDARRSNSDKQEQDPASRRGPARHRRNRSRPTSCATTEEAARSASAKHHLTPYIGTAPRQVDAAPSPSPRTVHDAVNPKNLLCTSV